MRFLSCHSSIEQGHLQLEIATTYRATARFYEAMSKRNKVTGRFLLLFAT
jgi:hypothetical protein